MARPRRQMRAPKASIAPKAKKIGNSVSNPAKMTSSRRQQRAPKATVQRRPKAKSSGRTLGKMTPPRRPSRAASSKTRKTQKPATTSARARRPRAAQNHQANHVSDREQRILNREDKRILREFASFSQHATNVLNLEREDDDMLIEKTKMLIEKMGRLDVPHGLDSRTKVEREKNEWYTMFSTIIRNSRACQRLRREIEELQRLDGLYLALFEAEEEFVEFHL